MSKNLTKLNESTKEYVKTNKYWTKIDDSTLLIRHNLKKSLKSKFTIIWFSVLSILIITTIIVSNLTNQGTTTMIGVNVVVISILMILTIAIFNIVNLNDLFSNDHELGIMNLEIRKGKSKTNIFLSRLATNKIISLVYILLMMCTYLILVTIINKHETTLFWMFLTYIPIDLILTGVFLFFFSFFKYKTAISFSSVLLSLILITPLISIVSQSLTNQSNLPESQSLTKSYAANQVLNLAYDKNEQSFVYNLLNDAQYLNKPLTEMPYENLTLREAWKLLITEGLISDFPTMLNTFWNEFQIISANQDEKPILEFSQEYKNSFFATLINNYSGTKGIYEQEYKNSLYLDNKVNNTNYQKMINDLKLLIKIINLDFKEYQDVQAFNNLVLEYAQGMLYASKDNTSYQDFWDPQTTDWIHYPIYLQNLWTPSFTQSKMGFLDKEKIFQQLTISPTVRIWNQITIQLISNALNYKKEDMTNFNNKDIIKAYLIPWTAEFESWFFANPNLNFYEVIKMDQSKIINGPLNYYWIYNYPSYIVVTENNEIGPISKLQSIVKNDSQSPQKLKVFNVTGFNLTIIAMALTLISISYFTFSKKLKK